MICIIICGVFLFKKCKDKDSLKDKNKLRDEDYLAGGTRNKKKVSKN
jgi:hypothetical protein